ncbi:hypothetical protein SAMN04490220_0329 [Rhodococcus jostii]|uniref:Uncharacterized protein n=1 Tax=Rhodococcus jostii TaxID=132919 RepID=A0A1H4IRH5_RHOJO|nr:hypothetical protein SAMN04490220_0329 [Rhodococcus jostii]
MTSPRRRQVLCHQLAKGKDSARLPGGRHTPGQPETSVTNARTLYAWESVRIPGRPFETVELIENLVDGGGRDTEVFTLRSPETVAYVGEHGEFTLDVCCGSVAHGLILR